MKKCQYVDQTKSEVWYKSFKIEFFQIKHEGIQVKKKNHIYNNDTVQSLSMVILLVSSTDYPHKERVNYSTNGLMIFLI